MKTVNISIPVRVSECGRYCEDDYAQCNYFRNAHCEFFDADLYTLPGEILNCVRLQQCLDAEIES